MAASMICGTQVCEWRIESDGSAVGVPEARGSFEVNHGGSALRRGGEQTGGGDLSSTHSWLTNVGLETARWAQGRSHSFIH